MLGFIFRGAFLIGILTWYSSNVWQMIDGYFKEQFRSYLEEEYRKNPRMRQDVEAHAAGNAGSDVSTVAPEATVAPPQQIARTCQQGDTCPVEAAESQLEEKSDTSAVPVAGGGTGENEVTRESTDKNAFRETAESGLESRSDAADESGARPAINHQEPGKKSEVSDEQSTTTTTTTTTGPPTDGDTTASSADAQAHRNTKRKTLKLTKKTESIAEATRAKKLGKKRKVKTILLTEEDFATAKGGRVTDDDDFWEFEEDAEERESPKGVLVSELPFKPRADIGDLERVTQDEYCPLTVEDEGSCGESVTWP